jgi:hypothetical protein
LAIFIPVWRRLSKISKIMKCKNDKIRRRKSELQPWNWNLSAWMRSDFVGTALKAQTVNESFGPLPDDTWKLCERMGNCSIDAR